MIGKILLVVILLAITAAVAIGCTSGDSGDSVILGKTKSTGTPTETGMPKPTDAPQPTDKPTQANTLIGATWIEEGLIEIEGDSMSIPVSEIDSKTMLHFGIVDGQSNRMNFMVYGLNGETYARANLCPPCKSVGFSLLGDILVCDRCGTRFDAITGDGISGACRDYPKAAVAHTISDGRLAMQYGDLLTAYANTGKPGWP
jgi:nitrite reductase/ring-hydroxylating ferredoxin subunit